MTALDFTEIPEAHVASGKQDTFELLAKEFFRALDFEILSGPDRGIDGGRDLLLLERRTGALGVTEKKWLVSCKHKAHSGNSVSVSDEQDIQDRVKTHGADAFIGFYSTVPSSSLSQKLEGLKASFEVGKFDFGDIETTLLETIRGRAIAKRYFPRSFKVWEEYNAGPANIFDKYEPLRCKACGEDLLAKEAEKPLTTLVAWVSERAAYPSQRRHIDIYWACKGSCDAHLKNKYHGYVNSWEDIGDIAIPAKYVEWNMALLNTIYSGRHQYEESAFEKIKEFSILVAQLTMRNQTEEQKERLRALTLIPPEL